MKNLILILFLLLFISACENEPEAVIEPLSIPTEQDSIFNYKGSFIMAGNSAVLKGNQFIYQVKMDSLGVKIRDSIKGLELKNQAVVPIEVRGKVVKNPASTGYSNLIEIKELLGFGPSVTPEDTQQ